MSTRRAVGETYMEGFRSSDHEQILGRLSEEVVWELPGFKQLEGKNAFDGEIENETFVGSPTLNVDRLIKVNDTVVAIGSGASTQRTGEVHRFAFCDVFTFAGDFIARVESYVVSQYAI